jgi:hypothetical protein
MGNDVVNERPDHAMRDQARHQAGGSTAIEAEIA